jgi:hypothetical protein
MREKENNRILVEEDTRIMCTKNRRQEVQVGDWQQDGKIQVPFLKPCQ